MKPFSIIVAMDRLRGIGKNSTLAWHIPGDMKYFQKITTGEMLGGTKNAVIMGRTTWESIPEKHRPLKDRINCVLSRSVQENPDPTYLAAQSLNAGLALCEKADDIFVIGGATLYREAITHPLCDTLYITEIDATFDCDTFFPEFTPSEFVEISKSEPMTENGIEYRFVVYKKIAQ